MKPSNFKCVTVKSACGAIPDTVLTSMSFSSQGKETSTSSFDVDASSCCETPPPPPRKKLKFFKPRFEHHPNHHSDIFKKDTILPYEKEKCELEKLRHEMEKLLEDQCPLPMGKITEMQMLSDKVNRAEKEVKEVQNALYVAEREIKKIQEDKVYSMKRATIWNGWLEITKKGEEILKHVQLTDLFETRRSTIHVQN